MALAYLEPQCIRSFWKVWGEVWSRCILSVWRVLYLHRYKLHAELLSRDGRVPPQLAGRSILKWPRSCLTLSP